MPAGVVPHASDVAVGTRLDMTAEGCRAALHESMCSFADVGGQGMGLLVGRKRVLQDRLQGHEGHRGLRTCGMGPSSGWFFTVSRQLSPRQAVSPTGYMSRFWVRIVADSYAKPRLL